MVVMIITFLFLVLFNLSNNLIYFVNCWQSHSHFNLKLRVTTTGRSQVFMQTNSQSNMNSQNKQTVVSKYSKYISKLYDISKSFNNIQIIDPISTSSIDNKLDSIYMYYEDLDDQINCMLSDFCKYLFFIPSKDKPPYDVLSDQDFSQILKRRYETLIEHIQQDESSKSPEMIRRNIGIWSHFLSLTLPDLTNEIDKLQQLRIGIDAFELRVDLLKDKSISFISRQIAILRDFTPLPLVYTVRTQSQLGQFPLEPSNAIVKLLECGLKNGVEYLDIEACLPSDELKHLKNKTLIDYKHNSKVIGSFHVTHSVKKEELEELFKKCDLNDNADILKVVTGANSGLDNILIHEVGASNPFHKPYIGLCLGSIGSKSRVLNQMLTPVTHELLSIAAPGQLSVTNLMKLRISANLIQPKKFYLFGFPISQSRSPAMHNNGFQTLQLPNEFSLLESQDINIYKEYLHRHNVGGFSVTIPYKEEIMSMIDEVSGAAKDIGSVNTIVIRYENEKRKLIGYNTDWIGIYKPIKKKLFTSTAQSDFSNCFGLVLGAGGTARAACYAIRQLGLLLDSFNQINNNLIFYDRTSTKNC